MIERTEMNDLLTDLRKRGFDDEQLASDLRKAESYGLPVFSVKRTKQFGDENMDYRLLFMWNDEEMKFELSALEVKHRLPVIIDPIVYNGFDAARLDKDMALLDWKQYWTLQTRNMILPPHLADAAGVLDGLAQLLLSGGTDIVKVAEDLMYKYFPAEIFAIFATDPERYKRIYEHSFNYELEHYPQISAELAYLLITERADSLESQLGEFIPGMVSDSAIRNEVYNKLKANPKEVLLQFNWVTHEGLAVELNIPVEKKDNWPHVLLYQLIVSQLPELPKGVFNGVDAEILAKRMAQIDWKDDEDLVFADSKGDIAYTVEVELIQEELFRMALEPEGKIASDLLMLRYFQTVPFFEDLISETAYKFLENLPKKVVYLSTETSVDEALNMIKGNPVQIKGVPDHIEENWFRLEFSTPDKAGELIELKGVKPRELEEMVAVIPMKYDDFPGSADRLMKGERIETESKSGVPITIMMTKEADRVIICDTNGKEIPFNFHLDPDWKPDIGMNRGKQKKQQRSAPKSKPVRKNK